MSPAANPFAEVEAHLASKLDFLRAANPALPEEELQRRLIAHFLWPQAAGDLLEAGNAAAERGDLEALAEMLARYRALLLSSNRELIEQGGLHPRSGYDYSDLFLPALYFAAELDFELVEQLFHLRRPLPKQGYPAFKAAAGLLVCLCHPQWPPAEKALAQADKFLAGKSASKADKALAGYLLALARADAAAAEARLRELADLFLKSDYGRHQPQVRPIFFHGLLALARRYRAGLLPEGLEEAVLGPEWHARWRRFAAERDRLRGQVQGFQGRLAFLQREPARIA